MQVGCRRAQLVARWPDVRQARVQISAHYSGEIFPSQQRSNEENGATVSMNEDGWLYCMNVTMNVCIDKDKINKKRVAIATNPGIDDH